LQGSFCRRAASRKLLPKRYGKEWLRLHRLGMHRPWRRRGAACSRGDLHHGASGKGVHLLGRREVRLRRVILREVTGKGLPLGGDRGGKLLPSRCLLEDRADILCIRRSRWACGFQAATCSAATCSAVWHTTSSRSSPSAGACLRLPSGEQAVVGAAVGLWPGCARRG
jgi:hypothetical protein